MVKSIFKKTSVTAAGMIRAAFLLALLLLSFGLPAPVWAESGSYTTSLTIQQILTKAGGLVQQVVALLVGVAVLLILWGILKYISKGGDAEQVKEARRFITFGIVGLFVMVSIWALVYVIVLTVGFGPEDLNRVPSIPRIQLPPPSS